MNKHCKNAHMFFLTKCYSWPKARNMTTNMREIKTKPSCKTEWDYFIYPPPHNDNEGSSAQRGEHGEAKAKPGALRRPIGAVSVANLREIKNGAAGEN